MRIIVGSKNPVKIAAAGDVLRVVFEDVHIDSMNVASGIPEQPWGERQTRQGAYNRARAALNQSDAEMSIGFEGGVIQTEYGLMSCAWCCVIDQSGRLGFGGGVNFLIPPQAAVLLNNGLELGDAMDRLIHEENTKQREGAVGILTAGLIDRRVAYAGILSFALAPFIRKDLYQGGGDL